MAKESNSFEIGLKMEKVWPVPIIGPILLKQLKTALTTVMKLLLSRLTTKSKPIVIKLYIVKYLRIWCWVSLSSIVSLTCKVKTRFGDKVERTWFFAIRHKVKHRMTFNPQRSSQQTHRWPSASRGWTEKREAIFPSFHNQNRWWWWYWTLGRRKSQSSSQH